jgi:hypothetical protein
VREEGSEEEEEEEELVDGDNEGEAQEESAEW